MCEDNLLQVGGETAVLLLYDQPDLSISLRHPAGVRRVVWGCWPVCMGRMKVERIWPFGEE